jgi:hypothetical protein
VNTIGVRAFYNCDSLTTAVFPESLRTICDEAFRHDIQLTDVDLQNTEFIGFEAFRMCHTFTEIVIPDTVIHMRGGAFYVCDSVERIVIGNGISVIEERVFGYDSVLSDLTIKGRITSIREFAFYNCASLHSISIVQATDIGSYAFYGAMSLNHIDLGNRLTSIGDGAFWGCKALIDVHIPETVNALGQRAFSECSSLTDIYFDGDMPTMGEDVFYGTDVTVHYLSNNRASWDMYDGKAVVDSNTSMDTTFTTAISLAAIVMMLVIVIYVIRNKHWDR